MPIVRKRNTTLNAVLNEWDEKTLPNGARKYFSVRFINKSGELQYIQRGYACGLPNNIMTKFDYKAVQPVDLKNKEIGHVTPVWIHAIIEFNNNPVL